VRLVMLSGGGLVFGAQQCQPQHCFKWGRWRWKNFSSCASNIIV